MEDRQRQAGRRPSGFIAQERIHQWHMRHQAKIPMLSIDFTYGSLIQSPIRSEKAQTRKYQIGGLRGLSPLLPTNSVIMPKGKRRNDVRRHNLSLKDDLAERWKPIHTTKRSWRLLCRNHTLLTNRKLVSKGLETGDVSCPCFQAKGGHTSQILGWNGEKEAVKAELSIFQGQLRIRKSD